MKLEDLQTNNQIANYIGQNQEQPKSVFNYQGFGQGSSQNQNQTVNIQTENTQKNQESSFGGYSMGQQDQSNKGSAFGGFKMGQ